MSFWKTFCTCAGCAIGAACIIFSGGTATPLVVAAAVGVGGVAGHLTGAKIEKDEKKVKNKEKDLAIRDKTIESLRKENESQQSTINNLRNQKQTNTEEIQNLEKKASEAHRQAKNPNLSEEERTSWKSKARQYDDEVNQRKQENTQIDNQIKELQDKISNNNKTISSVGSGFYSKDKGVWEFITLENILIVFAIYALWQIIKEDSRR